MLICPTLWTLLKRCHWYLLWWRIQMSALLRINKRNSIWNNPTAAARCWGFNWLAIVQAEK